MGSPRPERKSPSRIATVLTGLYLLLVLAALAILLLAGENDSLAGIYFILITFPWSVALTRVAASLHVDSMLFNTLFLLAGGLVNGFILYRIVSWLSRTFSGGD